MFKIPLNQSESGQPSGGQAGGQSGMSFSLNPFTPLGDGFNLVSGGAQIPTPKTDSTPADNGNSGGNFSEEMRKMKSHFDTQFSELSKKSESEITFLRNQLSERDKQIMALRNSQTPQVNPVNNQPDPFESKMNKILESMPEAEKLTPQQREYLVAQIGGDIRGIVQDLINKEMGPLRQDLETMKPLNDRVKGFESRQFEATYRTASNLFEGQNPMVKDPEIQAAFLGLLRQDPRVMLYVQAGNVDALVRTFEQNFADRSLKPLIQRFEEREKERKAAEDAASQSQKPSGGSLNLSNLPANDMPVNSGSDAVRKAFAQLGMQVVG